MPEWGICKAARQIRRQTAEQRLRQILSPSQRRLERFKPILSSAQMKWPKRPFPGVTEFSASLFAFSQKPFVPLSKGKISALGLDLAPRVQKWHTGCLSFPAAVDWLAQALYPSAINYGSALAAVLINFNCDLARDVCSPIATTRALPSGAENF